MLKRAEFKRRGVTLPAVIILLIAVATCGIGWLVLNLDENESTKVETPASSNSSSDQISVDPSANEHSVYIRPGRVPRVKTGLVDDAGNSIDVSCATCHATRKPNPENRKTDDLDEFHMGLTFQHGSLTCLSCHNSDDYDSLKLADGQRIEFQNVMTLCAQCHSSQTLDYQHGAHGGMSGYWDLSRGPQTRNNCVDCHDPHAPQFPQMTPTFKPRDRFLERPTSSEGGQHD